MSTTVSYKGQTLTTVSNDTKTLLTEGKYLEDDLTLVDVSGGGSTLITKNISANGTYNASSDSADGYSQVNVAVPASAVDTGTKQITANGNNQDVVGYAAVDVAVPNSYSAGDEGKVVDNGALVAQTAHADVTPSTSDQTIDTTTNNSIKVKGDANLVAGNIKKDVTIFNTTGTYEGGGGGVDYLAKNISNALVTYHSDETLSIRANAFRGISSLETLVLTDISFAAGNYNLAYILASNELTIDLTGSFASIPANCFNSDSKMGILIIRNSSAVSLANSNAFASTPFASAGAGGTLYVPNSLISTYQGSSNWSTILGYAHNSIKSIESTHTDPTAPFDMTLYYADGTPIT